MLPTNILNNLFTELDRTLTFCERSGYRCDACASSKRLYTASIDAIHSGDGDSEAREDGPASEDGCCAPLAVMTRRCRPRLCGSEAAWPKCDDDGGEAMAECGDGVVQDGPGCVELRNIRLAQKKKAGCADSRTLANDHTALSCRTFCRPSGARRIVLSKRRFSRSPQSFVSGSKSARKKRLEASC